MYAGFWRRFAAYLIDSIILSVVQSIISTIFGIKMIATNPEDISKMMSVLPAYIIVSVIITWLYFALLESSSMQATIGKMALGIKVTDLNGEKISFGRATGRSFAKYVSQLTILIGYIMAGFTEKKQALHDMIAKTLVVKK